MARFFPLLAALSTAVVAQTTVNLVIPLDNPEVLYGAVVNVAPEATTYVVACPEGSDGFQCLLLNTAQTVIQGPSTVSIHYSYGGDEKNGYFTEDLACKVNFAQDVATCNIQIAQGKKGGSTVTTSVQTTQTALNKVMRPVTITKGVDLLSPASSTAASSAQASTTATPASSGSTMAIMTSSQAAGTAAQSTGGGSSAPLASGSALASASASATPAIVNGASGAGLPGSPGALVVIGAFIGAAGLM